MDKLRKFLNGNDQDEDGDSSTGIIHTLNSASTLSWSTRIQCFIACFIIGLILTLFGSIAFFLKHSLTLFSIFYTSGNIVSILSTCFLMGPVKQIKKMFASTRVIATVLALVMIVLTLFAALYLKNAGLTLLFLIMQWLALTWYSLSYIPYARDAVKKTVTTCIA